MGKWKEVARIDPEHCPGERLRTRHVDRPGGRSYTAVEVYEGGERDITSECTVELVQSHHSDGYYCSVLHDGKSILALGVDEASKCLLKPHYRIKKAYGATVSFRILKND